MNVMFTDADWDVLEQILRGCAPVRDEECAYLKKAFLVTERAICFLSAETPIFLFRYKRLRNRLSGLVDAGSATRGTGSTQCVGGTKWPLDREKLRRMQCSTK
jgi:hypothetical protein